MFAIPVFYRVFVIGQCCDVCPEWGTHPVRMDSGGWLRVRG
jgi:hypothetical protein